MNFVQLLQVLLGRWKLIVAIVVGVVVLAGIGMLVMPKKYTATAALLVDPRGANALTAGGADPSTTVMETIMATQSDLVSSERVARLVATSLKLDKNQTWIDMWMDDTDGAGDKVAWIGQRLLKRLDVKPGKDSSVLNVSYTGYYAKQAANIANGFARASLQTNLELKTEPARQLSAWFDERNKMLRQDLQVAQEKLADYQQKNGMINRTDGGADVENTKLAQLTGDLVQVQQARAESNLRQSLAKGNAAASPDVLNNPVIANLRIAIATSESNSKQLGTLYGDNHPQVIAAREQLAAQRAQLAHEMNAVATSLATNDTVNEQREVAARKALDEQRQRVLSRVDTSNDASSLQHDIDSAQRALEAATTRQFQTSLESQVQQSSLYLLNLAEEPTEISSPKVLLTFAAAGALGLLLALAVALWLEARSPLLRSVDDLSLVLDLPLLANLPRVDSLMKPRLVRRLARRFAALPFVRQPA